jgi:hypothetical protein
MQRFATSKRLLHSSTPPRWRFFLNRSRGKPPEPPHSAALGFTCGGLAAVGNARDCLASKFPRR